MSHVLLSKISNKSTSTFDLRHQIMNQHAFFNCFISYRMTHMSLERFDLFGH